MFRFVSFRGRTQALLVAAGLFVTGAAQADLKAGYATGTGSNTSSLIVDFAFVGGDAYLFEYRYDGSVTSEQMLLDLDRAGDLTVHHQFFTFGGESSIFIDGFSFGSESEVPVFEGAAGENWSYWGNEDYAADPSAWVFFDSFGPSGRALVDGSADGFGLNVSSFNSQNLPATNDSPGVFTSQEISQISSQLQFFPVPEPSSAAVLVFAGAVVLRRRRG